jgi:hypothetical protein
VVFAAVPGTGDVFGKSSTAPSSSRKAGRTKTRWNNRFMGVGKQGIRMAVERTQRVCAKIGEGNLRKTPHLQYGRSRDFLSEESKI